MNQVTEQQVKMIKWECRGILDKEIIMCNLPQWLTTGKTPWPL